MVILCHNCLLLEIENSVFFKKTDPKFISREHHITGSTSHAYGAIHHCKLMVGACLQSRHIIC